MADTRDNGGPAFPFQGVEFQELDATKPGVKTLVDVTFQGMSVRDYFAAKAMQALISKYPEARVPNSASMTSDEEMIARNMMDAIAIGAYGYADAMLEARSNPSTK